MEWRGSHVVGLPATWVRVLNESEDGRVALLLGNNLSTFCRPASSLVCVSQFSHLQGAHCARWRRWDEWSEVLEEFFQVNLKGLPRSTVKMLDRLCVRARRLSDRRSQIYLLRCLLMSLSWLGRAERMARRGIFKGLYRG